MIERPNPEQQQALEAAGDLIVSAAAGAGKTAVMVAKAAKLIIDGQDVRRILMVTFTNKAAAEMKQRIKADLADAAKDGAGIHRLRRQMSLVDSADISTIHSFCIRLVKQYFDVAGVDPMFRMCGETELAVYKLRAMDELIDSLYNGDDPDAFRLQLRALAGGSEARLRSFIEAAYGYAMASPEPEQWLENAVKAYQNPEAMEARAQEALRKAGEIAAQLERAAFILYEQQKAMDDSGEKPANANKVGKAAEQLSLQAEKCRGALALGACSEAANAMPAPADLKVPNALKGLDEGARLKAKELVGLAKDGIKNMRQDSMFIPGADVCLGQQQAAGVYADALCNMVLAYRQNLAAIKRQENVLDFNDAEHCAYTILKDDAARAEISERYDHIFVDEYQDTNDIQEAIIKRVAREDTLFCVGDVKQSIYAFRHAEPKIFMRRYNSAKPGGRVDLNRNYRSNPGIIAGINRVFERRMSVDVGGVDYGETQRLYAGRENVQPVQAELELIIRDKEPGEECAQAQAIICARRIERLLSEQLEYKEGDEVKTRSFTYGDIAILTYTLKNKGGEFMDTLIACGVPIIGSPKREFYSQSEVSAVLCILHLLDNGSDDLSLIGALRSPAGGLSASDLAELRLLDRDRPLYELSREYADAEGSVPDKLRSFYSRMERWARLNMTARVHELVADIIDHTGMAASYALLQAGEAQAARLDALVRRAQEYSSYSPGGLSGFLQLVDLDQATPDASQQAAATGDSVSMLTIHGSKGLEFPAVICVINERDFTRSGGSDFRLHKHMGIGLQYYSESMDALGNTHQLAAINAALAADSRSEEMRLLYVALTRAKERLILTAAMNETDIMNALQKQPEEAKSWMDWVLPAIVDSDKLPESPALHDLPKCCCGEWKLSLRPMPNLEITAGDTRDWGEFLNLHNGGKLEDIDDADAWIDETIGWEYPYASAVDVPSKIAASSIGEQRVLPELKRPGFLAGEQGYTNAELGSLIHKAMMLIDLRFAETPEEVRNQLDGFVVDGMLDEQQAKLVDPALLSRFACSPLGGRAIAAGNGLLREQPFNLAVRAGDVLPGGGDERLLVQGVVDMAFKEGGEWVIVDYKTNRLGSGGLDYIAGLYRNQMSIYARALRQISGLPVKEVYIYMLRDGIALDMTGRIEKDGARLSD